MSRNDRAGSGSVTPTGRESSRDTAQLVEDGWTDASTTDDDTSYDPTSEDNDDEDLHAYFQAIAEEDDEDEDDEETTENDDGDDEDGENDNEAEGIRCIL